MTMDLDPLRGTRDVRAGAAPAGSGATTGEARP